MSILKSCIEVVVLNLELDHISLVAPIERLDVFLDTADHLFPFVVNFFSGGRNTSELLFNLSFCQYTSVVH
jgi:hypothetical protein